MKLSESLNSFLGGLKSSCIDYCILRNYENLPESNIGNDIDLLISRKDIRAALKALLDMPGARITAFNERAYVITVFMDGIQDGDKDSLQLDLVTDLAWKGLTYLSNEDVFSHSRIHGHNPLIRVPAPHHEAVISFFSSYLLGGWIKDRYQEFVRQTFQAHTALVKESLSGWISSGLAEKLLEAVCTDNRDRLIELLPFIRKEITLSTIKRAPFSTARNIARHYAHEIKIRYTGYPLTQFCVLGVDGAGKSTIIHGMVKRLGSRVKGCEVIHLKPRKRTASSSNPTCPDPHGLPPRNNLISGLKLLSWVAMYHWRKQIHGHSNSTLIIWDRYIYDTMADPRRYRVNLPEKTLAVISRLAPRPDGLIALNVSPEVAYARKPEVELPLLHDIQNKYIQLAQDFEPSSIVDTSKDINESIDDAMSFISATLSRNARKKIEKAYNLG